MKNDSTSPKIDAYLKKTKTWQDETKALRAIMLECSLTEEMKWGKPCYTFQENNVVLIAGFKEYCALMLFKGALLKDAKHILIQAGKNTQAARQIRFTSLEEIITMKSTIKAYIREAIAAEKAGLKVIFKKNPEPLPEELQNKFKKMPALKKAFEALTPGRQRAYILHFSAAKQSKTRESRIEKCIPEILAGKGLHDDYMRRQKKC